MRMLVHPESAIKGEGRVKGGMEDKENWDEGEIVCGMEIAWRKGSDDREA
jgi:hypothetical protein